MSREVIMEALSKEYGWTPAEIKELTYHEMVCYLGILRTKKLLEQNEIRKQRSKHGGKRA